MFLVTSASSDIAQDLCGLQLLVTLRYYATGTFQSVCGDTDGVDQSTASRAITRGLYCSHDASATLVHVYNT